MTIKEKEVLWDVLNTYNPWEDDLEFTPEEAKYLTSLVSNDLAKDSVATNG